MGKGQGLDEAYWDKLREQPHAYDEVESGRVLGFELQIEWSESYPQESLSEEDDEGDNHIK